MARKDYAFDAIVGAEEGEGFLDFLRHERSEGLRVWRFRSAQALDRLYSRRGLIVERVSGCKTHIVILWSVQSEYDNRRGCRLRSGMVRDTDVLVGQGSV